MKRIDEKQILLAVGDVGDDLLLRAEQSTVHKQHYRHWYVLAACFCLVVVLAVPNVMHSFRMGSSASGDCNDAALETIRGGVEASQQDVLEGIWGSAVIVEVRVESMRDSYDSATIETQKGDSDTVVPENGAVPQSGRAARLLDQLRRAKVTVAENNEEELHFTVKIAIILDSGETVEALGDVENAVVKLNDYYFYCDDLSILF